MTQREIRILLLIFCAAGSKVVFNLVPGDAYVIIPFGELTDGQGYVFLAFTHVMALIFISALTECCPPSLVFECKVAFALELITCYDFLFRYGVDFLPGIDTNTVMLSAFSTAVLFKPKILRYVDRRRNK